MRVHFIAIGGSAMHNLAIALHKKGYNVSGSDDEVFEPSKSRLLSHGLLPDQMGWNPDAITSELDAIILGMHAHPDNPELARALEMGLKVYSYPEYLYEQCKDKKRVVVGGSHGKTTITSMIMHVLKTLNIDFDYMVGAQLEGFDTMVKLTQEAPIAVFEGDEYLSSPIDRRPKFHWYFPHIALLSGVAWDHINVFPTWENYVLQFDKFASFIKDDGALIYYENDPELKIIAQKNASRLNTLEYGAVPSENNNGQCILKTSEGDFKMEIFGEHNLQNMNGARLVCNELGISDKDFYTTMQSFKGAAKRLQKLAEKSDCTIFLDFAHSPSKLEATTKAVKQQFNNRELIACMELHTFSSLSKDFLPRYKNCMAYADKAFVYFNPEVVKHKRLPEISAEMVKAGFASDNVTVFTDSKLLQKELQNMEWRNKNLLLMSSGNFSGIDFKSFANELIGNE